MRKILVSIVTILTVTVLAFAATRAAWSDTGTSSGNTFAAGTLDLKLSDGNETDQDAVTLTWNGSLMTPGGAITTATLNLKNVGNPGADHVHLAIANTITPGGGVGATETDPITKYLQMTELSYDGVSILGLVPNSNGNGWKDLDDFATAGTIGAHTGALPLSLELTDLNVNHPLVMAVQLHANSPDQNQSDTDTMVMTATLHQADGQ